MVIIVSADIDDIDASFNRRYKWFRTGGSRRAQRKFHSSNLISHATRRRARPRDSSSFVPSCFSSPRRVEGWKRDKGERSLKGGKNNCLPIEQLNLREKIPWSREREGRKHPKRAGWREREQQALGVHDEASYRPILIFVYTANNCEAGLTDHRP